MDRESILERLAQAERQIGASECEAARLRHSLERAGDTPVGTRQALQVCEQLQAEHRAERSRLLAELAASKAVPC